MVVYSPTYNSPDIVSLVCPLFACGGKRAGMVFIYYFLNPLSAKGEERVAHEVPLGE